MLPSSFRCVPPNQETAHPALHLGAVRLNPYAQTNSFTVRATELYALGEGSYRLSVQHVDEQGRLTGQTVFQRAIPAERIKDGRVELNLTIAQQLNYSGAYRLVLERVTPGKDGAGESVEQLAVEDIPVNLTHKDELQAAERWFAERQILPDPSPQSKNSNLTRRDVTVRCTAWRVPRRLNCLQPVLMRMWQQATRTTPRTFGLVRRALPSAGLMVSSTRR